MPSRRRGLRRPVGAQYASAVSRPLPPTRTDAMAPPRTRVPLRRREAGNTFDAHRLLHFAAASAARRAERAPVRRLLHRGRADWRARHLVLLPQRSASIRCVREVLESERSQPSATTSRRAGARRERRPFFVVDGASASPAPRTPTRFSGIEPAWTGAPLTVITPTPRGCEATTAPCECARAVRAVSNVVRESWSKACRVAGLLSAVVVTSTSPRRSRAERSGQGTPPLDRVPSSCGRAAPQPGTHLRARRPVQCHL